VILSINAVLQVDDARALTTCDGGEADRCAASARRTGTAGVMDRRFTAAAILTVGALAAGAAVAMPRRDEHVEPGPAHYTLAGTHARRRRRHRKRPRCLVGDALRLTVRSKSAAWMLG
jgi:hypothetical protein